MGFGSKRLSRSVAIGGPKVIAAGDRAVGALQVAMDDALLVRVFESLGGLSRDRYRVLTRNVGMIERGEHLRLASEARAAVRFGREDRLRPFLPHRLRR